MPVASEGEASIWEHRYHEIQQCGNEICERIFVQRVKGHQKISAEALFKPCTVRFKSELTTCVLLTLWPLNVTDPKVVETSYYSGALPALAPLQVRVLRAVLSPKPRYPIPSAGHIGLRRLGLRRYRFVRGQNAAPGSGSLRTAELGFDQL